MSYFLPHLTNGWQVDQAILSEEDRVVIMRFGRDWDTTCMKMDETLFGVAGTAARRSHTIARRSRPRLTYPCILRRSSGGASLQKSSKTSPSST